MLLQSVGTVIKLRLNSNIRHSYTYSCTFASRYHMHKQYALFLIIFIESVDPSQDSAAAPINIEGLPSGGRAIAL